MNINIDRVLLATALAVGMISAVVIFLVVAAHYPFVLLLILFAISGFSFAGWQIARLITDNQK